MLENASFQLHWNVPTEQRVVAFLVMNVCLEREREHFERLLGIKRRPKGSNSKSEFKEKRERKSNKREREVAYVDCKSQDEDQVCVCLLDR